MTDAEAVGIVQRALRELGLSGSAKAYDPIWPNISASLGDIVVLDEWSMADCRTWGYFVVSGGVLRAVSGDDEALAWLKRELAESHAAMRASADREAP